MPGLPGCALQGLIRAASLCASRRRQESPQHETTCGRRSAGAQRSPECSAEATPLHAWSEKRCNARMLAGLLLLSGCGAIQPLLPITLRQKPTGERAFVDSAGRERFFHGTNAIAKGPPWVPTTDVFSPDLSMVDRDFAKIQSFGMNMLRLGTMWPGVEPVRGQYNASYLEQLEKIVQMAAARGIYTLLDMHQDGLSEMYCGEGIPEWAVSTERSEFPLPVGLPYTDYFAEPKSNGAVFPSRQECAKASSWTIYQGALATNIGYERLYTNVNGTGDAWASMWARVASHFKGQPEILGLELMNEPFAGDVFEHPEIAIPWPNPANADQSRLQPAYDRINRALRKIDDEVLLFFAGVTWDDAGPGFSAPPGGEEYADRSVLAYHYYEPPQENTVLDVAVQVAGARRLKTGIFLTETCSGDDGGVNLYDAADQRLQSWACEWAIRSQLSKS